MKLIERITLTLFSTLMLIISVVSCILIFGWMDVSFLGDIITKALNDTVSSNTLLGLSILFILLSIRCIFFDSKSRKQEELKNGVLLENSDGKLFITRETIENLVNNIAKGFDSAEDIITRVELDKENKVSVFVNMAVGENAIIKELSTNLQTRIKETVKKSTDLDVKEVNIKVKNVEPVKPSVQE